jgi:hypothetical protein
VKKNQIRLKCGVEPLYAVRRDFFALLNMNLVLTQPLRWNLAEMRRDFARKGLLSPDKIMIGERFLRKRVDASDLTIIKDFFRFHAATSLGKIVEKLTADFINNFCGVVLCRLLFFDLSFSLR